MSTTSYTYTNTAFSQVWFMILHGKQYCRCVISISSRDAGLTSCYYKNPASQKTTFQFIHWGRLCRLYILYFGILTSRSEWLKDALRFLLLHSTKWPQYICRGLIGLFINTNDSKITLTGAETFSTTFPVHLQYPPTSHIRMVRVNQHIKNTFCAQAKNTE